MQPGLRTQLYNTMMQAEGSQTQKKASTPKMLSDEENERPLTLSYSEKDEKLKQYWAKKARRRSSDDKILVADGLGLKDLSKVNLVLHKNGERNVLFSECVIKVNRKGRTQDRWLMITDGAVYNIDPASAKVRRRIALANISHVSCSLLSDNFFIIHVPSEYDYLFISSHKTEIVRWLRLGYLGATGEELTLAMQNVIDYRIDKDQQRRIMFQQGEDGVFTKIYAKKAR